MLIHLQATVYNTSLSLLLSFILFVNIKFAKAPSSSLPSLFDNEYNHSYNNHHTRGAEEYVMTSAKIDGIKRSNMCGDGYRIEGAILKSYSPSKSETYLPHENCFMTFQTRRANHQMRIHIIKLDLNDIYGGTDCLDSLRFYKSTNMTQQEKLSSVECGKITETENFNIVSPTGTVTAHFSTDGGNVNGLGFKVILTAFRYPNKSYPCNQKKDEFLCNNGDCISSSLLCDGVPHCLDRSDERPVRICSSNTEASIEQHHRAFVAKHQHWRGIMIIAFLLMIFIVFIFFMAYFTCRRCFGKPVPLTNGVDRRRKFRALARSPLSEQFDESSVQTDKNLKSVDDENSVL